MRMLLPLLFLLFSCENKEQKRIKLDDELIHFRIKKVFQEGTWIKVRDSLKADSSLKSDYTFMTRYNTAKVNLSKTKAHIEAIQSELKALN